VRFHHSTGRACNKLTFHHTLRTVVSIPTNYTTVSAPDKFSGHYDVFPCWMGCVRVEEIVAWMMTFVSTFTRRKSTRKPNVLSMRDEGITCVICIDWWQNILLQGGETQLLACTCTWRSRERWRKGFGMYPNTVEVFQKWILQIAITNRVRNERMKCWRCSFHVVQSLPFCSFTRNSLPSPRSRREQSKVAVFITPRLHGPYQGSLANKNCWSTRSSLMYFEDILQQTRAE
jgi:hypothetical protein